MNDCVYFFFLCLATFWGYQISSFPKVRNEQLSRSVNYTISTKTVNQAVFIQEASIINLKPMRMKHCSPEASYVITIAFSMLDCKVLAYLLTTYR